MNITSPESRLASVRQNNLDDSDAWRRDSHNALIAGLQSGGALTRHQTDLLLELWPDLDDDWAASPYFRTVREHSRTYIDQARKRAERSRSNVQAYPPSR